MLRYLQILHQFTSYFNFGGRISQHALKSVSSKKLKLKETAESLQIIKPDRGWTKTTTNTHHLNSSASVRLSY